MHLLIDMRATFYKCTARLRRVISQGRQVFATHTAYFCASMLKRYKARHFHAVILLLARSEYYQFISDYIHFDAESALMLRA